MSISITLYTGARAEHEERLQIHHVLFLLFIMLKPFYLRSSGTLQVSDFVFLLSFVFWFFHNRGRIAFTHGNQYYLAFVLCVLGINIAYSIMYFDSVMKYRASDNLLVNILYYTYNLLVVLQFSDSMPNHSFIKSLYRVSIVNIIIQAVVFLLGYGRYYYGIRYQGTFNDPNQLAFFLFMSFLVVFVLSSYFRDRSCKSQTLINSLLFLVVIYLIAQSGSTGVFLGVAAFSLSMVYAFLHSERGPLFTALKCFFLLSLLIAVFFVICGFADLSASENYLMQRVSDKIDKVYGGGIAALLEERGIDKMYNYPQYLFFGSGEGNYARFAPSAYEVHSTIPSILFAYGILPFLLLFKWFRVNLKKVYYVIIPAYIGLLFESLTLLNQRQPMFWMLILLGSLAYQHKNETRKFRITRRI